MMGAMINEALAAYLRSHLDVPMSRGMAMDILLLSMPRPVPRVQFPALSLDSGITIRLASIAEENRDDLISLFRKAWAAIFPREKFSPDIGLLLQRERTGNFVLVLVSRSDGGYVGMAGMYLSVSDMSGDLVASEHLVYLDEDVRRMGVGAQLGRYTESLVSKIGASKIALTVRAGPEIVDVLRREGFDAVGTMMEKRLDRS